MSQIHQNTLRFYSIRRALDKSGLKIIEPAIGDRIWIDGVLFKILGIKNPEITSSPINNSSMIFKISGVNKSVIFLGDLELEGRMKLLKIHLQEPCKQTMCRWHIMEQVVWVCQFIKLLNPKPVCDQLQYGCGKIILAVVLGQVRLIRLPLENG